MNDQERRVTRLEGVSAGEEVLLWFGWSLTDQDCEVIISVERLREKHPAARIIDMNVLWNELEGRKSDVTD